MEKEKEGELKEQDGTGSEEAPYEGSKYVDILAVIGAESYPKGLERQEGVYEDMDPNAKPQDREAESTHLGSDAPSMEKDVASRERWVRRQNDDVI